MRIRGSERGNLAFRLRYMFVVDQINGRTCRGIRIAADCGRVTIGSDCRRGRAILSNFFGHDWAPRIFRLRTAREECVILTLTEDNLSNEISVSGVTNAHSVRLPDDHVSYT